MLNSPWYYYGYEAKHAAGYVGVPFILYYIILYSKHIIKYYFILFYFITNTYHFKKLFYFIIAQTSLNCPWATLTLIVQREEKQKE